MIPRWLQSQDESFFRPSALGHESSRGNRISRTRRSTPAGSGLAEQEGAFPREKPAPREIMQPVKNLPAGNFLDHRDGVNQHRSMRGIHTSNRFGPPHEPRPSLRVWHFSKNPQSRTSYPIHNAKRQLKAASHTVRNFNFSRGGRGQGNALRERGALSSRGLHRSTFGDGGLNFRVRNGIG